VYEQFLGKVIRLTASHHAVVEDKPEVKKAGGVFYTPAYIVNYIVEQTVGVLLRKRTAKQANGLRIVDPACGSGSFLIGAYQYLLDWYLSAYISEGSDLYSKGSKACIRPGNVKGEWRLTTTEKKRILLEHIYGVDVDAQAVEVTKLSLLLKVLEGESGEYLTNQMKMFRERVLPDIDRNIQCGNSIVAPDFYDEQLSLDDETALKINVFDWRKSFPTVFKNGGFDAVIGNPPYGATVSDAEKAYLKRHYQTQNYKYDTYVFFMERAIGLLNEQGRMSFITPELWTRLESSAPLRKYLSLKASLESLKFYGDGVFSAAVVSTCVCVVSKSTKHSSIEIITSKGSWKINVAKWKQTPQLVLDFKVPPAAANLISKISGCSSTLGELGEAIQGVTAYDKYRGQTPNLIKKRGYHAMTRKDKTFGKWLEGKDVNRYQIGWSGEWLSYGPWLGAPREPRFFKGERLLFREVPGRGRRIQVTYTNETAYYGHSITPFLKSEKCALSLFCILGIANSRLLSWYGELLLPNFGKEVFPKLNPQDIKLLPIRKFDFSAKRDVSLHEKLESLVGKMLALNEQLNLLRTPQQATSLKRQIDLIDDQIDRLVYEIYGLSESEIRMVEHHYRDPE
jgi:hypothetical protein